MSPKISEDDALDPLAKRVADFMTARSEPVSSSISAPDSLRWFSGARRRRTRMRWMIGMAATAIAVAGGVAVFRLREGLPAKELSYRLDNVELPAGGYVLVPDSAESLLAFSDGSKVRMSPRTRGRVVELSARGARFALESGKVSVDIVQRPRAHWVFQAGPFSVTVHGTSFTVAWNPLEAVFEMRIEKGTVSVSGPVGQSEVWLNAGQALKVSLRDQLTGMGAMGTHGASSETSGASDGNRPVAAPPTYGPAQPALAARSALPRWSNRGWTATLAEGKAAAIVSDAERTGVAAVLDQADSEDLRAFANAARYAGRYSLARQALTAQRWNRRDEALDVALDYVRRFPDGTYANAARALVRALR